jgi:hypothetical protein
MPKDLMLWSAVCVHVRLASKLRCMRRLLASVRRVRRPARARRFSGAREARSYSSRSQPRHRLSSAPPRRSPRDSGPAVFVVDEISLSRLPWRYSSGFRRPASVPTLTPGSSLPRCPVCSPGPRPHGPGERLLPRVDFERFSEKCGARWTEWWSEIDSNSRSRWLSAEGVD